MGNEAFKTKKLMGERDLKILTGDGLDRIT